MARFILTSILYVCLIFATFENAESQIQKNGDGGVSTSPLNKFVQDSRQKWRRLMENENGNRFVMVLATNTKEVLESQNAGNIITGMTRQIRTVLTNKRGAQSLRTLSDGLTRILTDNGASQSINGVLNGYKTVATASSTALMVRQQTQIGAELLRAKYTVDVIKAIGDGCVSFMELPNPKESIIQGFANLKKFMSTSWKENIITFAG